VIPRYPQRDFSAWKSAFNITLVSGTKAWKGLNKWIRSVAEHRASLAAFFVSCDIAFGSEPVHHAKPEDARGDVLKMLWNGSIPNVIERTDVARSDKQFLEQMEKLKGWVEEFAIKVERRNTFLVSQDRVLPVRLHDVLEACIHLSTSIATVSALVRRKNMQPLKLTDCCRNLVWELETNHGLSQAECHALIKCALRSHGCTPEQVAPFDTGSVQRGTIRAKKAAFIRDVRNSYDVITQVFPTPKQPVPDVPMKKSPQ